MRNAILGEEAVDPVGAAVGAHRLEVVEEVDVDQQLRRRLARKEAIREHRYSNEKNQMLFHGE